MKTKKYVIFSVKNNNLSFEYKEFVKGKKHVNTNDIFEGCFLYDLKYFEKNIDNIIKVIYKLNLDNVKSLVVYQLVNFTFIKIIMEKLNLENLKLMFLYTISKEDYDILLNINGLMEIDTYYMPSFICSKFIDKKINVKLNNNYKISERFLLSQDCLDYDSLYYRKDLEIKENYDNLLKDIEEFLRVNYYLKAIYVRCFDKLLIESIINLIKNDESKNVIVFLHQVDDKGGFISNNFQWLKEINIKCKEEEICEFRIVYSDNYVSNNLFKQLTFNNLKLISILGVYLCAVAFIISKSYAYVEELNENKLNHEIINSISSEETEQKEEELSDEAIDVSDEDIEKNNNEKKKYTFTKVFSKLKKINKNTVGYLTINNTEISYPVVQAKDNNYYLNRDIYKKKAVSGWIYMDYRNNHKEFDDNTIIYGHNMRNGTMFGSLSKVLNSSWRRDEENMTIIYDTEDGTRLYKIFSAYKVDYTTDYLKTSFDNETAFNKFVKMITKRSVFTSKEKVKYGDKILTLSTCTGTNNKRLVVHAVLIDN